MAAPEHQQAAQSPAIAHDTVARDEWQCERRTTRLSVVRGGVRKAALGATVVAVAVVVAGCGGTSQGAAVASKPRSAPKTVTVIMHDPGCHWFEVGNGFSKSLTVNGPVALRNVDEATLKVNDQLDPVGGSITLGKGSYRVTMVGQAPDDNHLKLTVR